MKIVDENAIPIKPMMPTYEYGFVGIRRHRGLWHRFLIRRCERKRKSALK